MNGNLRNIVLALFVATGLAACSGGKQDGIGAGNDSFRVTRVDGTVATTEEKAEWSIPASRRFNVEVCLKSNLRDAAIGGESFHISSTEAAWDARTDARGCLRWHEDWSIDLAAKPAGILETRKITSKNGLVKGSVDVRLAFNPWSGLIGGGKAVSSPDLEPSEVRVLSRALLAAESERASLHVPSIEVSLQQSGERSRVSGELNIAFPLSLNAETAAGKRVEYPFQRGVVLVEVTIRHRASGAKAFDSILLPKQALEKGRVELKRYPVQLKRRLKTAEAYDVVLKVVPLGEKLGFGAFAGRFELGAGENIASGTAMLAETISVAKAQKLETEFEGAEPTEKLASLRLVGIAGTYFGVAKEEAGKRTVQIALAANFVEPAFQGSAPERELLVKGLDSDEWTTETINRASRRLEWIGEYTHAIPAAKVPVSIKLEIRDPETGDEWERLLVIDPWQEYSVTVKDVEAIAGAKKDAPAAAKPPVYRLDELCLGKPANPRLKVEPSLDLSFRIQLSLALKARIQHDADQMRGPHDEALRPGDYRLDLIFLRTGKGAMPQVISTVSRALVADGAQTLDAQIDLPVRTNADLIAQTQVLAQISDAAGKVESEPQLFELPTMASGCDQALDPAADTKLQEIVAEMPKGLTLREFHEAFVRNEAARLAEAAKQASPNSVAKKLEAKLYDVTKSRPSYMYLHQNLGEMKSAMECLARSSWDSEYKGAACIYEDGVKVGLLRMCRAIVHPSRFPEVPLRGNGFVREAAQTARRKAINDADALFHMCARDPLRYFSGEKKIIVTEVGETKPEHDLGAFHYHISTTTAGRMTGWAWDSFTYEVERLFFRYLRGKGTFKASPKAIEGQSAKIAEKITGALRGRAIPMNAPVPKELVTALQRAGDAPQINPQVRGGIINDAFDYYYDLDYNMHRFGYSESTDLDVTVYDVAIPARRSQECYLVEGWVPEEDVALLQTHKEYATGFKRRDLVCLPESQESRLLPEKFYFVVNSPASGVTVDAGERLNRLAFAFRGERDYTVFFRAIRENARPFQQNGVALEITRILREGHENFEKRAVGVDAVFDVGPEGEYVRENPNPGVLESLGNWLAFQFNRINPFDKGGTTPRRNQNSPDLNPEFTKKHPARVELYNK